MERRLVQLLIEKGAENIEIPINCEESLIRSRFGMVFCKTRQKCCGSRGFWSICYISHETMRLSVEILDFIVHESIQRGVRTVRGRPYSLNGIRYCVETEQQRQRGKGTAPNSNAMVLCIRYCLETESQRQRGKGTASNSNAVILCIRYCVETELQRQRGKGTALNSNVMVLCIRYCLETEPQRQRGKGTASNSKMKFCPSAQNLLIG